MCLKLYELAVLTSLCIQAAGFNAVSVYHHWGLSEGKAGSLDFNYHRSHTELYEVAKEVGLLVIARPGVSRLLNFSTCSPVLTHMPASRISM